MRLAAQESTVEWNGKERRFACYLVGHLLLTNNSRRKQVTREYGEPLDSGASTEEQAYASTYTQTRTREQHGPR